MDVEVLGAAGFGRLCEWTVLSARGGQRVWLVVLGPDLPGRRLFGTARVATAVFEKTKSYNHAEAQRSRRGPASIVEEVSNTNLH